MIIYFALQILLETLKSSENMTSGGLLKTLALVFTESLVDSAAEAYAGRRFMHAASRHLRKRASL